MPVPPPNPHRTPRLAARMAVIAPDGAVFMFRYDNAEVGVHWSMPGGGIDAASGESPLEGAKREVREETGWTDLEPGALLCTWEHDYTRPEGPVRQQEFIYLTRTRAPRRDPVGDLTKAHAEDGILRWRWWTQSELAQSTEALWPPQLPDIIANVLRAAPDAPEPVHLGYVPNPDHAPHDKDLDADAEAPGN